jgi:hypothetical protein
MAKLYPLDWPSDIPRSRYRQTSKFKTSFDKSLLQLRRELKLLGAQTVGISSNLPPARDGWPDARGKLKNNDPGVAVYWNHSEKIYVLACDVWDRVEDNLWAIVLTIGADRAKVRWGCAAIESRSMAGYIALPPPPKVDAWWEVFGCSEHTPIDEVRAIYKARLKKIHPDFASTNEERRRLGAETARLNAAMEAAERNSHAA